MNRYGVAVASDSAITVTGKATRTYNSGEKISYLETAPVAVLQSGSDSVYGVPWQVLLKMWSQMRGEAEFETIRKYARSFCEWLNSQAELIEPSPAVSRDAYRGHVLDIRSNVIAALNEIGVDAKYTRSPSPDIAAIVDSQVDRYVGRAASEHISDDALDSWSGENQAFISESISWAYDDIPVTEHLEDRSRELGGLLAVLKYPITDSATLAFCGYGRDRFFPSIYHADFAGAFGSGIETYEEEETEIRPGNRVAIIPLGLSEPIYTFLGGTSRPFDELARRIIDTMASSAARDHPEAKELLEKGRQQYADEFMKLRQEQFIQPMLDVVETLPINELTRLADALVGLASLRQVVRGETSVGGPSHVARITRHGDFAWERHKGAAIVHDRSH
jgi:hypothetical protein